MLVAWRSGPVALALACVALVVSGACALEPGSPEDTLVRYLKATKEGRYEEVFDLSSKAMRMGKSKDAFVKDSRAMMSAADVKIFDFAVQPGKVEGDKALVPNVLESQDRFANTLGLTEYELYTLVREDAAWRIDSQVLVERPDMPKWFPKLSSH